MDIGLGIALLAGFLSFASPCVLPIVPGYLTFITGMSFEELTGQQQRSHLVVSALLKSLPFVLGFSLVFIALGASASAAGAMLRAHLGLMKSIAGVGIIILGLHLAGVLPIPALLRDKHLTGEPTAPGIGRAFIAGILFAFGWTPCVGPILAGILGLAATTETLRQGVLLLSAYSLGLGIPFIISAAFLNAFLSLFKGVKGYLRQVEVASGMLLVVVGLLIFTDKMAWISSRLTFLNPEELLMTESQPAVPQPTETAEHAKTTYGDYDFTLTSIDGESLKLSDYHGKVVLVNFWAPWCGPCVVETPALVRLYNKYKSRGFAVIGVALQSEEEGVKRFVKDYHVPYAIGRDASNEIGLRYQVFALPSSFLFSSEGKVKRAFTGFLSEETLEHELQAMLGPPVTPPEAPRPEGVSYKKER
ncbi:MAG: redoxin domain-containing protein [Deltaproteobacteria bacterium]|nr:redoxin domain-containing protein [Deltaproteobacteria bacterium]